MSLVSTGIADEFIELGAANTDSALDHDLADTDLYDAAKGAGGILPMAYSMAYGL